MHPVLVVSRLVETSESVVGAEVSLGEEGAWDHAMDAANLARWSECRRRGSALKLRVPGEGVTFRDAGTVTYVPNQEYETPSGMHGVHDRFSGADLDALICDGLT